MLQWMGGSRRKVTTSRKSIQKRQKQYFEHRRRQQHQQIAGLEECSEGGGGGNKRKQSHKQHKSLDILNLLNFSTSSHDCKPNFPTRREEQKINASTVKYHIAMDAPVIQASTVIPADPIEINRASSLSDCQVEILSPKKTLLDSLDTHSNSLHGVDNKPDLWNTTSQQQVSFFDLLGDDESNGYVEAGPTYEAHVAFSVDGLGKVEAETPPQSPQQPDRYVSYGCFSPLKAARQLNSSRNCDHVLNDLELEVDAIMQDLEMPLSGSSLDFSTGTNDSYDKLEANFPAVRDHMQLDGHNSKIRSSLSYRQAFCDTRNNYEDLWDDRFSLLAAESLDERQCDISWKSWSCHFDGDSSESLKHGKPNYAFGGPQLLKKRDAAKATTGFNFLDSSPTKHQKSENDYDVTTSKGARHHLVATNGNFEDVTGHPDWSSFVLEDPRKSPSLLSEESCSSTAVRGESTNNPVIPGLE
eukprot:XP_015577719.1 uncharacterized protein LOC8282001 [Ricinus communis]